MRKVDRPYNALAAAMLTQTIKDSFSSNALTTLDALLWLLTSEAARLVLDALDLDDLPRRLIEDHVGVKRRSGDVRKIKQELHNMPSGMGDSNKRR